MAPGALAFLMDLEQEELEKDDLEPYLISILLEANQTIDPAQNHINLLALDFICEVDDAPIIGKVCSTRRYLVRYQYKSSRANNITYPKQGSYSINLTDSELQDENILVRLTKKVTAISGLKKVMAVVTGFSYVCDICETIEG